MASAREIKRRMKSVKNIMQVTMALEAVSASKVRKATQQVLASRAYADLALDVLSNVASATGGGTAPHPLLEKREGVGTVTVLLITSDRGLAGAYNSNITRVARMFASKVNHPVRWVAVGRKGRDILLRAGEKLVAEFTNIPSQIGINFVRPIAQVLIDEYLKGQCDEVYIAYTDFINTLTQRPRIQRLLPLIPGEAVKLGGMEDYIKQRIAPTTKSPDYIYEPNANAILDEIVPKFTQLIVFQSILESTASEHASRMVAMRNASDNAKTLVGEYQLSYNKARQSAITSEILDIIGGAEALKDMKKAPAPEKIALADLASGGGDDTNDDLTVIEGIGPKMAAALNAAGITSYQRLSIIPEAELKAAIAAAGLRLAPTLNTWAEQAGMAARGEWDALKAYQDQLGRK